MVDSPPVKREEMPPPPAPMAINSKSGSGSTTATTNNNNANRPRPSLIDAGTVTGDDMDSAVSPGGESDDDADDDDEGGSAPLSARSWHSPNGSAPSSTQTHDRGVGQSKLDDMSAGEGGPTMPIQKRRRVTRACDECRRKKIKCDGKQPCTHCQVYSYECTYDKPSNRRRNPAPQYIEALENRLRRAEALLRKYAPDVDLTDPNLDSAVVQEFRNRDAARARAMVASLKADEAKALAGMGGGAVGGVGAGGGPGGRLGAGGADGGLTAGVGGMLGSIGMPDDQLLSMIGSFGQLNLDEKGEWDFHGISSGAVFLRRLKEHFGGLLGNDYKTPFLPRPPRPPGMFNLDSPRSSASSPWDSNGASPALYDLPPRDVVRKLCHLSLTCATCLMRIVHAPSFYEALDKLYDTPPENYGYEETRFLGLLNAVMALGCMYSTPDDEDENVSYKPALDEGIKYYMAARLLTQDITECRDMTSLQALLFMILFLQASSNLSGCYSFVGIALRSALRMGLHRNLPHAHSNPIETEVRRRVFHVIRGMDTYVSALLGFPLLLADQDIDQPLPTEVDDEYITKDGILEPPPGTASFFEAFNAHARLMQILAKIIKYIYPLKSFDQAAATSVSTYMISYARIKEVEGDLQHWYERLSPTWRPSNDGPIEVLRVRHLLRFAYAHIQMMLYRPFLHYVSPRLTSGKSLDERAYACAAATISVSRNIVHIGIEMRKQGVLSGPYWFTLYTEYFAIIALVFFVLENPDKPGSADVLAEAKAGRDMMTEMASSSLPAERVSTALKPVFERLPERLKSVKGRAIPTKKRSAPGPKHGGGSQMTIQPQLASQSAPGLGAGHRRSDAGNKPGHLPTHRISFDAPTPTVRSNAGAGGVFGDGPPTTTTTTTTFQDVMLDLSASTPDSSQGLYRLDAVMFPSTDPFAYPNQPMMELSGQAQHHAKAVAAQHQHQQQQQYLAAAVAAAQQQQQQQQQHHHHAQQHHHHSAHHAAQLAAAGSPYYLGGTGSATAAGGVGMYDDLEGQLLGGSPLPAYMTGGGGAGAGAADLAAGHGFGVAGGALGLGVGQTNGAARGGAGGGRSGGRHKGHAHAQHAHAHAQQQQQDSDLDDLFQDGGDWNGAAFYADHGFGAP